MAYLFQRRPRQNVKNFSSELFIADFELSLGWRGPHQPRTGSAIEF